MRRPGRRRRITLGADKAYDVAGFVATCASFRVTPHVARNVSGRRSDIPDALAASDGYAASQRVRKRIEEVFAWVKGSPVSTRPRYRGLARVGWQFTLALAAYDLIRLPKLLAAQPALP